MALDLSAFTPEQIEQLKAQLGVSSQPYGWSPPYSKGVLASNPRQLHNLTLLPTKDDPRPTFFMSAESPRDAIGPGRPYPRLMWAPDGTEIRVDTAREQTEKEDAGYSLTAPPDADAINQTELIRQQLESLSPEDRQVLMAAAQKDRLARVQEAMAGLSEAELETLMASLDGQPAKRGPGRPRKTSAA